MAEEEQRSEAGPGFEVVETLATTETREHLLCRRPGSDELVQVQRLTPRASQAGDFVEIYLAEAQQATVLDHPNVVRVLEVSDEPPRCEVVCEHVAGAIPLDRLLDTLRSHGRVIPVEHGVTMMLDVAAGVAHAHGVRGEAVSGAVLHQDLAPENVLIDETGACKVADFGIGRASRLSSMTVVGGRQRRLGRLSPEQLVGRGLDERSDVFGLGVMLYEVTTGTPPFRGDSDFELMSAIDEGRYTPPSARIGGYFRELEAVVTRALATSAEDRFQSAAELREALVEAAREVGIEPSRAAVRSFAVSALAASPPPPAIPPQARTPAPPPPEGPRYSVRAAPRAPAGILGWLRRLFGLRS